MQLATTPAEADVIRLDGVPGVDPGWPEAARFACALRWTDSFLAAVKGRLGSPPLETLSAQIRDDVSLHELGPEDMEAVAQLYLRKGSRVQVRRVEWSHQGIWVAGAYSLVVLSRLDLKARKNLRDGVPLGEAIRHLGARRQTLRVTPQVDHPTDDPHCVVFELAVRLDLAGGDSAAMVYERVGMDVITGHRVPTRAAGS